MRVYGHINKVLEESTDEGERKYYEKKKTILEMNVQKLLQDATPNEDECQLHILSWKAKTLREKLQQEEGNEALRQELQSLEAKMTTLRETKFNIDPTLKRRLFDLKRD